MKSTVFAPILNLSSNEKEVFIAVRDGYATPLAIHRATRIPRPTVYVTLESLIERTLVDKYTHKRKPQYCISHHDTLEDELFEAKRFIFDIHNGSESVKTRGDSLVTIHRGKEALVETVSKIILSNPGGTVLRAIQGNIPRTGWNSIFGKTLLDDLNIQIKKNNIVSEAVIPNTWFENNIQLLGESWATHFTGRATAQYEIPEKYLTSKSELLIVGNTAYILALPEEVIIEIRNSAIVEMFMLFMNFFKDHGKHVNVRERLQKYEKGA